MNGSLIYKCRLCGSQYAPVGIPNAITALTSVVIDTDIPKDWCAGQNINVLDLHACDNRRIGISDLIGAELKM